MANVETLGPGHRLVIFSRISFIRVDNTTLGATLVLRYLVWPFFSGGNIFNQFLNWVHLVHLNAHSLRIGTLLFFIFLRFYGDGISFFLIQFEVIHQKLFPRLKVIDQHHKFICVVHCVCQVLWYAVDWLEVTYMIILFLPWLVNLKVSKKM